MHQISTRFFAFLFIGLLFTTTQAWAGQVLKVKGKKILIKLNADEADSMAVGDKLYLTTPSGKKRAIVIIRKKRGRNVIAQMGKGKAKKGMLTQLRKSKSRKRKKQEPMYEEASEVADYESDYKKEGSDLLVGLMGGFGSSTQNVQGKADMAGSSIAVKGIIDYSLFEDLGVRGRFGLDMFSVAGSDGSVDYSTNINYLTVDLLLRYYLFKTSSFGMFVNGGMGIYSPMSNELTPTATPAITAESIKTTSLLIFGLGAQIPVGGWKLFAGLDYFYFPKSENVSTQVIGGKLGVLFEL